MYMMMACPIIHDDKFDHLIKVGVVGQKMTSRDIQYSHQILRTHECEPYLEKESLQI